MVRRGFGCSQRGFWIASAPLCQPCESLPRLRCHRLLQKMRAHENDYEVRETTSQRFRRQK
jgi:hypothetical protein